MTRSRDPVEHGENVADAPCDCVYQGPDLKRLAFRPLIEGYLAGEKCVYSLLTSGVGDQLVAVLYRAPCMVEGDLVFRAGYRCGRHAETCGRDTEAPVLVDAIEVVEPPELVPTEVHSSGVAVVRLYLLDEIARRVGDTAESLSLRDLEGLGPFDRRPMTIDIANYRKRQPSGDLGREGRPEMTLGDRINDVIQRGTEVVDCISGDEAQRVGRGFGDLRPSNCTSRLGIYIADNGVGIRIEPSLSSVLKGFYVFACAFELQPVSGHRMGTLP